MYVNKETGEIYGNKLQQELDKATDNNTNIQLDQEDLKKLRATTAGLAVAQLAIGITAGVVIGKSIFTGLCIALAVTIISDMVTPTDYIYKQVLKHKS